MPVAERETPIVGREHAVRCAVLFTDFGRVKQPGAIAGVHANTIGLIHDALPDVPILLDIPGRKIRTAQLAVEPSFERDDIIVLTTESILGSWETTIPPRRIGFSLRRGF